ncbi:cysteine--1-D-myo-inosityl 2-amino-2-deoxy-alpha-D-glucopyranoside ligase [Propionibacteriaceae bacterium Y1700]|uniref:cysteine--1-D-myo-inosityl 2-amino-2-deoxy-alpha-D-glucopyranoside ligase n=1 Tax=Microlunatus sp. Y1700 TaxID=3418487 RepID=UPI003DA6F804
MQTWKVTPLGEFPAEPGPVAVHDTPSGQVRPVGPAEGTARLYVCGITPYDATHMGHANTYVAFDLLHRAWLDAGLEVHYVQNATDVDDPLLERAHDTGVDWRELADEQIALFHSDMEALRVLRPQQYVGAVESIGLVTDMINNLDRAGAVYAMSVGESDLYFRQSRDDRFLSVSGLTREEAAPLFAERGGDPDREGKRDPFDSLLWRQKRPDEPGWESPYGVGRPGWHIECAAIVGHYLGSGIDVQGGGSDLVFPHHEMSASQARVATGEEFAKAYAHAGMVGLDGEKMSKSKGNLVLVSKLRAQGVDPMAIRMALLTQHYRSDWMWTDELLAEAEAQLARWREAVRLESGLDSAPVIAEMRAALRNDLDAPTALAAFDAWAGASLAMDSDDVSAPGMMARAADALLGISLADPQA